MIRRILTILIIFQIFLIFSLLAFISIQNSTIKSYSSVIDASSLEKKDDNSYFFQLKPNTIFNFSTPKNLTQASYLTNNDGLNEKNNIEISKPEKTIRIISLGNSFTFGLFVKTEDNYSEKVEELLNDKSRCISNNKFEVINLGVSGYGFDYAAKHFLDKALKYEPDYIIWMVQDESINFPSQLFYKLRQQIAESRGLVNSNEKVEEKIPGYNNNLMVEIELAAREEVELKYTDKERIEIQNKEFKLLNQAAPIPVSFFSYSGRLNGSNQQFIDSLTKKYKNIKLLNPISGISNKENHFADDAHPNENGHALIAENLFDQLKDAYCSN